MGTAVTNPDGVAGGGRRHLRDEATDPAAGEEAQPGLKRLTHGVSRAVRGEAHSFELPARLVRERAVVRVALGATLVTAVLPLLLWRWIGGGTALPFFVLGLATACWYGIALVLLERARGKQLAWMPWLNTTIEASLGAIVVAVAVRLRGEAWTAGSALPLLWPLTLLLVSARLRPVLCLYATALALVEHAIVHQLALGPALTHIPGAPFPTSVLFERSFWLLVGGVGAAALAAGLAAELSRQDAAARGRMALERELGRFVSTDVADAILRGEFAPGAAEKREVTVLFCDLRNFTGMCEREAPEAVVELLNEFYARAHAAVAAHGGTINKFLGDGFLALFNAPAEHPNHAYAAASVAHDLVDIAAALRARGGIFSSFDLGVGIDTGEVVVGAVGGPSRAEFTAIGAAVNRAARLQGLAGAGGHRVMLSAETAERLGPRANVVQVGTHQLKGFARPQPVYAFRYA